MQAIILAAGMGRRLGKYTENNTKCMLQVNGVRLIDRVLTQLSSLPLKRIIIVVGYQGQNLIDYVTSNYQDKLNIEFINNPIYDKTNNIYSLALAKEKLQEDDTILLESDLIFSDNLFKMIYECQMVNIYKLSRDFSSNKYVPFLEAYSKALGMNEYYEQVLRVITMIDHAEMKALPIGDEKWYEIDDIQDLDIAEAIFADDNHLLQNYSRRYGGYWRFPKLLDFCYLVNPYFPTSELIEEMQSNYSTLLQNYPSGMAINALLAGKYFKIKKKHIVVGNGAAELIKSIMEHETGKVGVIYPTFEEYPHRLTQENIIAFHTNNSDFRYDTNELMDYFGDKDLSTLLIINPDNPSGNFIPINDILHLAQWAKTKNIKLIVDESFVDFTDDFSHNSLLNDDILESHPNLIVVKSISKSYGVPGLRLGVLATADEHCIEQIKKDISIWNINSFAEFYMQIFGKYTKDYQRACQLFIQERTRFFNRLQTVDFLRIIPSQANYFLCEISNGISSKTLTFMLLKEYNILIKDCKTKTGMNTKEYVRIAIRNPQDNDRLVDALLQLNIKLSALEKRN